MKIAVLCSGSGTNLQAILDAIKGGRVQAQIALIISDKPDCFALTRGRNAGIATCVLEPKAFTSREAYDKAIAERLDEVGVELICLAGFMRILSAWFIERYRYRIMNIHPALLPAFPGGHAVRDALAAGVAVTGVTVHFVDEGVDTGPVICQQEVAIAEHDTVATLLERLHVIEHELYPHAIQLFCEGRLSVKNNVVEIKD